MLKNFLLSFLWTQWMNDVRTDTIIPAVNQSSASRHWLPCKPVASLLIMPSFPHILEQV